MFNDDLRDEMKQGESDAHDLWTAGPQRECRDNETTRNAHERKGEKENIGIYRHTEMPMPSSTSEEAAYIHISPC